MPYLPHGARMGAFPDTSPNPFSLPLVPASTLATLAQEMEYAYACLRRSANLLTSAHTLLDEVHDRLTPLSPHGGADEP